MPATETPEALVARARALLATWSEKCPGDGRFGCQDGRTTGGAAWVLCKACRVWNAQVQWKRGSGTRFPLRQPCPWPHNLETVGGSLLCANCGTGIEEAPGYLPHVTDSGLGEAIRRRGWFFRITQNPDGDLVDRWVGMSGTWRVYETLTPDALGLRDLDARTVAAARVAGMED